MSDRSSSALPLDKAPRRIEQMFDAIADRYDLLNRLLSAGFDRRWRRLAIRSLSLSPETVVLDVCTGTADLALAAADVDTRIRVIGVDFAAAMLRLGQEKVRRVGSGGRIQLCRGDAVRIPLLDGSVDAATIGFGIRNVADPHAALDELYRVLRPGVRMAILEFGYPRLSWLKAAYLWYFRHVLPWVGRLVSRHDSAYRYLPASVGTFYAPDAFRRLVADAGFVESRARPLTFGIVYLYTAAKPLRDAKTPSSPL